MPENTRIALAAVIVTGIVGVAGPLITWRATVDSQHASAQAEIARGDREDLRRVLDQAASNLDRGASGALTLARPWQLATLPGSTAYRAFSDQVNAVQFSADQLEIRLGSRSPVFAAYSDAWVILRTLDVEYRKRPIRSTVALTLSLQARLAHDEQIFQRQAHDLAASELR